MRIGLCAWSFTGSHREAGMKPDPLRPDGLAALACSRGLRSIEGASSWFAPMDPSELDAFRDRLEAAGLGLVLDTGGDNYAEGTAALDAAVDLAARLGAQVVRTTISRLLEGDRRQLGLEGWRAYLAALVEPLRRAAGRALERGVAVGLENHQDACAEELVWLCRTVGSPALGVTFDCGNAYSVGQTPADFAAQILPFLKHVHLKDYAVHATPSGYRLVRCPLGSGVVDWPALLELIDGRALRVEACIELGATTARHIRLYEGDYWAAYAPRPLAGVIEALGDLHRAARPPGEEWRTPHERGQTAADCAANELAQLDASVAYLRRIGRL